MFRMVITSMLSNHTAYLREMPHKRTELVGNSRERLERNSRNDSNQVSNGSNAQLSSDNLRTTVRNTTKAALFTAAHEKHAWLRISLQYYRRIHRSTDFKTVLYSDPSDYVLEEDDVHL